VSECSAPPGALEKGQERRWSEPGHLTCAVVGHTRDRARPGGTGRGKAKHGKGDRQTPDTQVPWC
jgi:hypothetical protein